MGTKQRPSAIRFNCQALITGQNCLSCKLKTFRHGQNRWNQQPSCLGQGRLVFHRYKKILVITCVLSDHHGIKLEFNNNSNSRKPTNAWKLNSQLLNHPWVKEEIKKEIKLFLEFMKTKTQRIQIYGTV